MDRQHARKSLDKKLESWTNRAFLTRPHRGWVKSIREAIGMSGTQFAERLGVSQPRITVLEHAEIDETITLASLRRAAEALDCTLVYAIVPKTSFEDLVEERARAKARMILGHVDHTMVLEKQNLDRAEIQEQLDALTQEIITKKPRLIWDWDKKI